MRLIAMVSVLLLSCKIPRANGVGLAPGLQPAGSENGGAIRGVLGDCNEDRNMYHAFVPENQSYYCNLADTETRFKEKYFPGEDLCDWGFGELVPRPKNGAWVPGSEWGLTPGVQPGSTPAEIMFAKYACVASQVAIAGGSSEGRFLFQAQCAQGDKSMCAFANATLHYPTSMGLYHIEPALEDFITAWRGLYHKPNINFGNAEKYYAGWVRKVVRCSDIPQWLVGKIASGTTIPSGMSISEMENATRAWRRLPSLLTESNLSESTSFARPPDYRDDLVSQPVIPTLSARTLDSGGVIEVNITGPADRWFGFGLGATKMADKPDTVTVLADGSISEQTVSAYGLAGKISPPTYHVHDSSIDPSSGLRSLVLRRNASCGSERFDFNARTGDSLPFIYATGMEATFVGSHVVSGVGSVNII